MGAELVIVSFSVHGNAADDEEVNAYIDWLGRSDDDDDSSSTVLKEGYAAYQSVLGGRFDRYVRDLDIPGGGTLYIVGGTSYGDDPFSEFSDVENFIDACESDPTLSRLVGFAGRGIVLPRKRPWPFG